MTPEPNINPFDLPPVVMERLSLEELIVKLLSRLNKGYMPARDEDSELFDRFQLYSVRPEYNSKPDYIDSTDEDAFFSYLTGQNRESGCYALSWNKGAIHAFLAVREVCILVNLQTRAAYARMTIDKTKEKWIPWTTDLALAVDRQELDLVIDRYL